MANLSTDTQSVIRLVSDLSQSLQREFLAFINPLTYGGGRGRGGGGGCRPPKVFLSFFFLEDKNSSAPDVFSSCLFIPRAHFETSLMMISFYGYEKWS